MHPPVWQSQPLARELSIHNILELYLKFGIMWVTEHTGKLYYVEEFVRRHPCFAVLNDGIRFSSPSIANSGQSSAAPSTCKSCDIHSPTHTIRMQQPLLLYLAVYRLHTVNWSTFSLGNCDKDKSFYNKDKSCDKSFYNNLMVHCHYGKSYAPSYSAISVNFQILVATTPGWCSLVCAWERGCAYICAVSVCHNTEREHVCHSIVTHCTVAYMLLLGQWGCMYVCHSMAQYSEGVSMPQYSEDVHTPQYRCLGTRLGPDHKYECEHWSTEHSM